MFCDLESRIVVPGAQNGKAQGNALGTDQTKDQSPKGSKSLCIPVTPFQCFQS